MIRLATVFSGIGSIEWAMKRMNLDYKITFACDNGDIELKDLDIEKERKRIFSLKTIEEQKKAEDELFEKCKKTNFVKKSYMANYDIDEKNFHYDIRLLDGRKYKGKVDLFVGGSPCQAFSIMGYKKGFEDTRGTLFYEYARLVNEIQPKVFIFENVQGLLKHDSGKTWNVIKKVFDSLGYNISYRVMDSKDYGIPQTRRRLIVVGFRDNDKNIEEPLEQDLRFSLQDFLETNTKYGNLVSKSGKIIIDKQSDVVDEKYFLSNLVYKHVMSTGTKNYYTKPEVDLNIARPLLATMHKMHRAGVDNYVTYKGRLRKLTPRECMRLMGYDDSFKIVVSDTQAYKQAGNSIVVDVMMAILKKILEVEDFS